MEDDRKGRGRVGVVLPGDNRQRVANTKLTPNLWIGQLETDWPNGDVGVGTATLIGTRHLLTCGHNFYDTEKKKWCTQARFRPGANRSATGNPEVPYGTYKVKNWYVPEDYVNDGGPPPPAWGITYDEITEYLSDYAVAVLERDVDDPPGPSLMGPNWPGDSKVNGLACRINGYSGDKDQTGHTQYTRTGNVKLSDDASFVTYQMSTYEGDSGSGVFYQPLGVAYWTIIAVHVTGVPDTGSNDGLNFGPSMSGAALSWVQERLV